MTDEQRHVLGTLAQRRDVERKNIQAIKQVGAKSLFLHHLRQVPIRRRNQARIRTQSSRTSEPFEFPFLKHSQQLWLQLQRNLSDLVEEYRSLVCQLKTPDPLRDRPGKGSPLVPEEFALE